MPTPPRGEHHQRLGDAFPLGDNRTRVYPRARHALWHGLAALGLGHGDTVLVPAYHHGSEIEPLVRRGITPRYYDVDSDLAPRADELDRLLDPSVRALFVTHFFGVPQDIVSWRRWSDQRGVLVIEDVAHGWLSDVDGRPCGSFGHLGLFCLYKTIALGAGGALFCPTPPPPLRPRRAPTAEAVDRARWLIVRTRRRLGAEAKFDPARDIALGDPEQGVTVAWLRRLQPWLEDDVAERRRHNFAVYEKALGADQIVLHASPGSSPWVFPLRTTDKPAVMRALARAGVTALDFWSVPHPTLRPEQFAFVADLRRSVVGLPVHQGLDDDDLGRVLDAALSS